MKKIIICLSLLSFIHVSGQDIWIHTDKFIYKRAETINLKFLTGKNFKGTNWKGSNDDVDVLRLFFEDVIDRKLDNNLSDRNGDSLQIVMLDEGTVVVTSQTKNSFRDIKANEFNDYLKENGLTDILKYRVKNGDTIKAGLENYRHCSKTIFQVGGKTNNTYKQKTGLPIDIIPGEHPYSVARDGHFKMKIFFLGKPLKNSKIKVWHRSKDKISQEDYTTDKEGEVKIFLSPEGEWMISCIKMVRLQNDLQAEWQSYRGSLTWGYH